jgi:ATP/maltotriose-dependent transcriptional regulator MalT
MAAVILATGDPAQAESLIEEATSALQHGAPLFLSLALYVRAILAVRRGNADQAIAVVRESLTHVRELHDTFAFVYALVPLAAAAVLKGDDEWAARILGTGTPSPNAQASRLSMSSCATSETRQNERCVHASARIGGAGRMRQGV